MTAAARPRILLVDDTPVNLILLGNALEQEFDLRIATSGEEGLKLAAEVEPDLVLLDIMMPGIDGLETCRRLKADPALRHTPVIFITALGEPEFEATGLGLGASDYLTKPINVELARQRIRNLVDRERLRKEVEAHRDRLELLVTQRTAQLEASETLYRGLVEQSLVGVYQVQTRRFRYVNPGFARMLGYDSPAEVLALDGIEAVIEPEDRQRVLTWPAGNLPSRSIAFRGVRRDGSAVDVETHERLLTQGGQRIVLGIALDVTERRRAEAAQGAALSAAERLAALKSEFVSNVSHELRTPLNAVLGFAEVGILSQDIARSQRYFGLIRDAGRQLSDIAGMMLDFSAIENGEFELETHPFDLAQTLQAACARWRPVAESKGLEFVAPTLPAGGQACHGDSQRLGQVLNHLLDNAIKFTASGRVSLDHAVAAGRHVFTVADTGTGMSAEQVGQAFTPFHQVDGSRTRQFGGLGLGLALVKYLVDRMRGEIGVESEPGRGTSFRLSLPLDG